MQAIVFDQGGNLTFDGTNVYDYDAENRLAEVSTPAPSVLYSFDPLDRRAQQNAEGAVTQFLYSGAQEIAEYDGLGNLIRRFVPGAGFGEVAVTVAATGERVYHHADALGSTVARSDETGAMVERYAYGPFGEEAGAPGGTPFRYTGQRFDAETGLYYYRARAYSPALGRFLQPDPIGTEGGINLYAYVGNDPLNLTDPLGLYSILIQGSAVVGPPTLGPAGLAEGGIAIGRGDDAGQQGIVATTGGGGGFGIGLEVTSLGFFTGAPQDLEGLGFQGSITLGPVTISGFSSSTGDFGGSIGLGPGPFGGFLGPTLTNVSPFSLPRTGGRGVTMSLPPGPSGPSVTMRLPTESNPISRPTRSVRSIGQPSFSRK